ncbi:MAG TPA: LysM peptidoglycan-binding domain-containing protein [Candidatus Onthocola gallistercoris]|uniref:LysM peptidoglycan-binding domain-containing protein n=1 Tax=Candidatus Onthocola gallistercoris TaxID=2840876 RepID=A0A9D1HG56_9FIRM|nr:LysM peptidoglycan-binding domain-containing protein [Candidatus Onthocola gallistercoris]
MKRLFTGLALVAVVFLILLLPVTADPDSAVASEVSAASDEVSETVPDKYFISYIVQRGDTLWDIAGTHMSDHYPSVYHYIQEIMESNHLESTVIKTGQMLILPCYDI